MMTVIDLKLAIIIKGAGSTVAQVWLMRENLPHFIDELVSFIIFNNLFLISSPSPPSAFPFPSHNDHLRSLVREAGEKHLMLAFTIFYVICILLDLMFSAFPDRCPP